MKKCEQRTPRGRGGKDEVRKRKSEGTRISLSAPA